MAYTHKVIRNCIFVGLCFFQSFTAKGVMPTAILGGLLDQWAIVLGCRDDLCGDLVAMFIAAIVITGITTLGVYLGNKIAKNTIFIVKKVRIAILERRIQNNTDQLAQHRKKLLTLPGEDTLKRPLEEMIKELEVAKKNSQLKKDRLTSELSENSNKNKPRGGVNIKIVDGGTYTGNQGSLFSHIDKPYHYSNTEEPSCANIISN